MVRETEQDRINQKNILKHLEGRAKENKEDWSIAEYPTLARLDAELRVDGKAKGIIEVKCRSDLPSTRHKTIWMNRDKYNVGVEIAREMKVDFLIGIRCEDVDLWWVWTEELHKAVTFSKGGRYDRGDPNDVCEVANLPVSMVDCTFEHPKATINRTAPAGIRGQKD